MVRRLKDRGEFVELVRRLLDPLPGATSEDVDRLTEGDREAFEADYGDVVLTLYMNSPDPVGAHDLLFGMTDPTDPSETSEPSPEELADRILALPRRDPRTLPKSELPLNHPYRILEVEG